MVAATYGFVSAFGQNIALIPTLTTGMKWFPRNKVRWLSWYCHHGHHDIPVLHSSLLLSGSQKRRSSPFLSTWLSLNWSLTSISFQKMVKTWNSSQDCSFSLLVSYRGLRWAVSLVVICWHMSTNKYQKYKSVELGDQLGMQAVLTPWNSVNSLRSRSHSRVF